MSLFRKIISARSTPLLITLAGLVVYLIQAFHIAHTTTSFLDEGLYTYKGWLFATGRYVPYQAYGVWTNHTVLSFLIPGYIQRWFGPGLDVARYFMICVALITLLGMWIFAKRWGGAWWACAAVWVIALNHAEIKLYTLAIPEGLVACMVVWMLVLTVGINRPRWQILLGAIFAALAILTRENMLFVLPILFLYVTWQYGWKMGLSALLSGTAVTVILTLWHYPDGLTLWASRLPNELTPFLDSFRMPSIGRGDRTSQVEPASLYLYFLYSWLTLRLHFVALFGAFTVWLLWSPRRGYPFTGRIRAAIFLSVLLLSLWALHVYAAFFGDFCTSCILLYVGYFDYIGILLMAVAFRFLLKRGSVSRNRISLMVALIVIVCIAFSTYEDLSPIFANAMIQCLLDVYIWGALRYVTGLPQLLLFRITFVTLAGSLAAILLGVVLLWSRRFFVNRNEWSQRVGILALHSLLVLGLVLSPTKILSKGNDFFNCDDHDVFASYAKQAAYLRELIPAGSKVYWDGRMDAIFLYLPDVDVYPPQLNHLHNFSYGGDADTRLRFGRWNDALARQWLAEADFILIEAGLKQDWVMQILESDKYLQLESTGMFEKCRWQSVILVFKNQDADSR